MSRGVGIYACVTHTTMLTSGWKRSLSVSPQPAQYVVVQVCEEVAAAPPASIPNRLRLSRLLGFRLFGLLD